MDSYLAFFMFLAMLCVLGAARHIIHRSQRTPTSNLVTQAAEESLVLAHELALLRLWIGQRHDLARLVLAIANTGSYKYGTPGLDNSVPNTFPLVNAMPPAMRDTSKEVTDTQYNKMIEALAADKTFLVACVRHSDKLRATLQFLASPGCDVAQRIPQSQALTERDVEVLENINRTVFRPFQ